MMNKTKLKIWIASLAIWAAVAIRAMAGTVIVDTVTYNGADLSSIRGTALPNVGYYMFDMVVKSTPTSTSAISGLAAYVQQQGVAGGNYYTLYNSTFTTCNGACSYFLAPDMYVGGIVRGMWAITSGSATIKITAREISP